MDDPIPLDTGRELNVYKTVNILLVSGGSLCRTKLAS